MYPVCKIPVEEWIKKVEITSTADVPIPEKLVDQVIGQEAASIVVRKAAEQRRHVIMVGEPGTGKSMLARSMTEFRDFCPTCILSPIEYPSSSCPESNLPSPP